MHDDRPDAVASGDNAPPMDSARQETTAMWPMTVALLEHAIHQADTSGRPGIAGRTRLTLARLIRGRPARRELFTQTLAWLGGQLDADAAWIGWWERCHILQQTSWLITDLLRYPDVTVTDLDAHLDALRRRVERAGYGMNLPRDCAYQLAAQVDGHAAADAAFQLWTTTPRDELSDDLTASTQRRVEHLAAMGRDQDALDLAFPAMVIDWLPINVARVGLPDQAGRLVAHALATTADIDTPEPERFGSTARLLTTLHRGGAIEAGLDLLRQWPILLNPDDRIDPLTRYEVLTGAYGIVASAVSAGMGEHVLATRSGQRPQLNVLERALDRRARDLAEAFDRRNRTDRFTARLDDLQPHTSRASHPAEAHQGGCPIPLAGRRDGAQEVFLTGRMGDRNEHPFAPCTDDLDELDLLGLRERFHEVRRWGGQSNVRDVIDYWAHHREQVLARSDPTDGPTASHAAIRAAIDLDKAAVWRPHHVERLDRTLADIATRYEAIHEHADALLTRQLIAIDALDAASSQATVAEVDACGTRQQRLEARLRLAGMPDGTDILSADEIDALLAQPPELNPQERELSVVRAIVPMPLPRAAEALDRCLDVLQPGEWPGLRATVLARRALIRLRLADQRDNAFADQLAAERAAGEAGELDCLVDALLQRARVVFDDDFAGSERNMLRARWAALQSGQPEGLVAATTMLVELLLGEGHLDEAYFYLRDALRQLPPDAVPEVPRRRHDLLRLRSQLYRIGARLLQLREMTDLTVVATDAETLQRCALDDLETLEDHIGLATAHFELAELLTNSDALEALHEYDLADALAASADAPRLQLVIARERIHATYLADGPDAALAAIVAAQARNDDMQLRAMTEREFREQLDWDFEVEELQLTEHRVRVLRAAKRTDAAMALVTELTARYQQTQHPSAAVRTRILHAELLMDQGRRQAGLDEFRGASAGARELGNQDLARFAALRGAARLEEAGDNAAAKRFWDSIMGDAEA